MANNGSTSANNRKRGNSGLMFVVCCFGFVGGLLLTGMGGLGFLFTLEGPGTYRFNGGDSQPSNPVRVKNAVCHVNQALDLGDECAVPVTEKPTTLKSYESVPLLFFIACHHTHGKSAPEPCTFVGNAYPMDVKDDTTQAKVKRRFPGFKGELIEPHDPTEDQEMRTVFMVLAALGFAFVCVGGYGARRSWRKGRA